MSSGSNSDMSYEEFDTFEDERCKRIEAERKLAALERKLAIVQPILNLFAKDKKTRGTKSFNENLDCMILRGLAEGRSAAAIRDFFVNLSEQFTFLLEESDDTEYAVPSLTYIERLRDCLPEFNQARLEKFVHDAESLTILTDDSPALNQGSNYTSLGLIDETGCYVNLGFSQNNQKTAEGIARTMNNVLEQSTLKAEIFDKLNNEVTIMSDSAHSQLAANRLVLAQTTEKDHNSAICLMHTTANCERMAHMCLDGKFQEGLHSLKLLFGARNNSGYHKVSLKKKLNVCLGLQNRSVFRTDLGARFAVHSSNARAMILYRDEVLAALNEAKKDEKHSCCVRKLMTEEWELFAFEAGVFALFFFAILAPFHTVISKTIPWKIGKAAILNARSHLLALEDSATNSIEKLFEISNSEVVGELTKRIIPKLKSIQLSIAHSDLVKVDTKVKEMAKKALVKFDKDTSKLLTQEISELQIVPLTNRRAESSFSTFKWHEKKFESISKPMLVNITMAKINHLSSFISEMVSI